MTDRTSSERRLNFVVRFTLSVAALAWFSPILVTWFTDLALALWIQICLGALAALCFYVAWLAPPAVRARLAEIVPIP